MIMEKKCLDKGCDRDALQDSNYCERHPWRSSTVGYIDDRPAPSDAPDDAGGGSAGYEPPCDAMESGSDWDPPEN